MWHSLAAAGPSGLLHSMSFPVDISRGGGSEFSGFVAENYGGSSSSVDDVLHVKGNNKLYLVQDWLNLLDWNVVNYQKLHLLGSILTFTVDLSQVNCDCNAAVYLVQMDAPGNDNANYCDIQGGDYPRCAEIDLLEGNTHAVATTLHVMPGTGADGTCNQLARPSRRCSSRMVGLCASMLVILISPRISAIASTPMAALAAESIAPSLAQSAFPTSSPPAVTPSTGQKVSPTSPVIVTSRPVRLRSWSAAIRAIRSAGSKNSDPTATTKISSSMPIARIIHFIARLGLPGGVR